jgi:hypothetical protein
VLVNRAVQVLSPSGDLDVGLIDEPPVARGVPEWSGSVVEEWGEPLHPPVHRDVIDIDATFREQLLDVSVHFR